MISIKFIVLAFMAAFLACTRPAGEVKPEKDIPQRVLFQQSFVNYAWGYQNRGWFIGNDGLMKAYRVSNAEYWIRPDSGYISVDDLLSNYGQAKKVIYKVPSRELLQKYELIAEARSGKLTEKSRSAYDAGLVQFSCYWWDQKRGMFKEVLLSLSGDWERINQSQAAIELDAWLKQLNQIYADSLAAMNKEN